MKAGKDPIQPLSDAKGTIPECTIPSVTYVCGDPSTKP